MLGGLTDIILERNDLNCNDKKIQIIVGAQTCEITPYISVPTHNVDFCLFYFITRKRFTFPRACQAKPVYRLAYSQGLDYFIQIIIQQLIFIIHHLV